MAYHQDESSDVLHAAAGNPRPQGSGIGPDSRGEADGQISRRCLSWSIHVSAEEILPARVRFRLGWRWGRDGDFLRHFNSTNRHPLTYYLYLTGS